MLNDKAQIKARYQVVTLLYRGNLEAAQLALESLVRDKLLSAADEAFYRQLLARAQEEKISERTATLGL